jgi:hypothetical protein
VHMLMEHEHDGIADVDQIPLIWEFFSLTHSVARTVYIHPQKCATCCCGFVAGVVYC